MNEKLIQSMIQLLEKGGTEGSEILRLYIWLHSPILHGFIYIICAGVTAWLILWIVKGWYKASEVKD